MTKGVNKSTGRSCRFIDRTGTRNGRLLFLGSEEISKSRKPIWRAICDCGNFTKTTIPNKTKSCGCLHREVAGLSKKMNAMSPEEKKKRLKEKRKKIKQQRAADPCKSMQDRLSRLHRHALSRINAIKSSPTFEQLGYSPEDFVVHMERQFLPGMSWENMSEWEIDHITPVSEAKTLEDVIALNQLSNLRPLWKKQNNKKKNKRLFLI